MNHMSAHSTLQRVLHILPVWRVSLDCCPSYFNLICLPSSRGSQGSGS